MENFYKEKQRQGVDYYNWQRDEVIDFIKNNNNQTHIKNVLEIGCGSGLTGKQLKKELNINRYCGVEISEEAAETAKQNLDHVVCEDFEEMIRNNMYEGLDKHKYDLILFLDVLEHTFDPWRILKTVRGWLSKEGSVVASIPNAGHLYVIKKLFKDRFEYEDSGLLDKTHIRFFTLHTINKMLKESGYQIQQHTTTNDLFVPKVKLFNRITFGRFEKLFIRQYIFMAKPV